MGSNTEAGRRAAATSKKKYGDDFHVRIGRKSAEKYMALPPEERKPRGMAWVKLHDPERFKEISAKGGRSYRKEQL